MIFAADEDRAGLGGGAWGTAAGEAVKTVSYLTYALCAFLLLKPSPFFSQSY